MQYGKNTMKIVLNKPEENIIYVIDNEVNIYDLRQISAEELLAILGDEKVLYVSEYIETSSQSLLDLFENQQQENIEENDDEKFLHITTHNKFLVQHNKSTIIFSGMYDIKPISDLPHGILTDCKKVVDNLKSGFLEIIGKRKAKELLLEKDKQPIKNGRANRKMSQNNIQNENHGSVDNPIEIDLGANGNFKRN